MGSNELVIDTPDTFWSTRQFKSQEEIEKLKADGASELLYGVLTKLKMIISNQIVNQRNEKMLLYFFYCISKL